MFNAKYSTFFVFNHVFDTIDMGKYNERGSFAAAKTMFTKFKVNN